MEYCNLFLVSFNISFPYLLTLLTLNDLTSVLKIAPDPLGTTLIEVEVLEYPIPVLIILTSVIFPDVDMTGLNKAPDPDPLESITSKSGTEKYSTPPNWTFTALTIPPTMMGFNCAFLPLFKVIKGFFSKLIALDPYPVPAS